MSEKQPFRFDFLSASESRDPAKQNKSPHRFSFHSPGFDIERPSQSADMTDPANGFAEMIHRLGENPDIRAVSFAWHKGSMGPDSLRMDVIVNGSDPDLMWKIEEADEPWRNGSSYLFYTGFWVTFAGEGDLEPVIQELEDDLRRDNSLMPLAIIDFSPLSEPATAA